MTYLFNLCRGLIVLLRELLLMMFGRPQRLCGLCQLLNADVTWFLVYNESRVNSILILSAREDARSLDSLRYCSDVSLACCLIECFQEHYFRF